MKLFVADIETTGLLPDISSPEDLHVLSYAMLQDGDWVYGNTTDPEAVERLFCNPDHVIVGHNFWMYDVLAIEKMLGITVEARVIDTLHLSWYLEPSRQKHGLADWGEFFGIPKPKIESWVGLPLEDYIHRCDEDVKINVKVWEHLLAKLDVLYEDRADRNRLIEFLRIKGMVYYTHYKNPFRLDIDLCNSEIERLTAAEAERVDALAKVMPKVPVFKKKSKPKNMFKKNGEPSSLALKWFSLLEEQGLPEDTEGTVEYVSGFSDPNPGSVSQMKDWFSSLGWKPIHFKQSWSKTKEEWTQVPQVKDPDGNLCTSIKDLAMKEPAILQYEDLGIIQHRLGLFKGFLRDVDADGNIYADIGGLTNTLRIKHRRLVNLPKPSNPWAEKVRACLLAPEGRVMIGSDLSSLESVTRNNFVYEYDPEFVEEQDEDYYDPHLNIGVAANMITRNESWFYKMKKEANKKGYDSFLDVDYEAVDSAEEAFKDSGKDEDVWFGELDLIRNKCKTTNYSSLYGVGAAKLSVTIGSTQKEARKLLDAYWDIHWSVKEFSKRQRTLLYPLGNDESEMWVRNPLNGFWYSLRNEKDIFSTVNQSAGDYIFTLWQQYLLDEGFPLMGGFHDEIVANAKEDRVEEYKDILDSAIAWVSNDLDLTIPVEVDYKTGNNYADVH